ncbi:hypothetical protein EV646_12171 [Kribbella antiqua]|uniref:Uncharacterized protein n=1 Tax=Kribbella antiqua TaxID=2512217 RepID=A0A4R2I4X6_9ACTN|nr:hypothetical protein [Kribbella antiqua]TCO38158.1 hypothetical protein EV646_12171 [Kribbella antiqua]
MTAQFRLLVTPKIRRQLAMLEQAAAARPGSLRDRELRALKLGLQALIEGREIDFESKRLGYSHNHHDLRDCAELKVPVIPESRFGHDLGPSHRLIYREYEAEDGGLPYREAICFEPRGNDRPFEVAGARLRREVGRPEPALAHLPNHRPSFQRGGAEPTGPPRLPLPPDLRKALAAASNIADARGAVTAPRSTQRPPSGRTGGPPGREL